jgi:hypothetical protein
VGLGRLELPTSPLSGVRSNHLSYRPMLFLHDRCCQPPVGFAGGADRDRTDGLLNANQALSQLSYSPLALRFNRRWSLSFGDSPPPAEALLTSRGRLDARPKGPALTAFISNFRIPSGDPRRARSAALTRCRASGGTVLEGISRLLHPVHRASSAIPLRSLLERR